ncbi:MAG: PadR family transcriptional regulator [Bryobacteraceae bacterium]|nr:PadR family transcriptional regulator [Bryobacteraceae bacterium]
MSLPHILLGLLSEPATGYELKQRFDQTLRHFWSAELSQIYPTLHRLHSGRLLTVKTQAPRHGPERRVYRRTAKGRRALLDWLDSPLEPGDLRIGYLARVFFAGEWGDLARTRAAIAGLRERFAREVQMLEPLGPAAVQKAGGSVRDLPDMSLHAYFAWRKGLLAAQSNLLWIDEFVTEIDARQSRHRKE